MDRVTVPEAARILGIKEESVRKRVSRGKLRADKDAEGRLLVWVDRTSTVRDESPDGSVTADAGYRDELVEELRDRVRSLEEANRENRRIIAGLVQRVPELEAAQEPSEGPDTVESEAGPERAEPRSDTVGAQEAVQRPWWRRVFG